MSAWAIVTNNEPLQAVEQAPLQAQGSEVVLRVTHAGVCHSDLHLWHGYYNLGGGKKLMLADRGVTLPHVPGHEIVGEVIAVGPQAQGVKLGDHRIVFPWLGCGECEVCRAGHDNLCNKPFALGVRQAGGFGQWVKVPDPRFLVDFGDVDPAFAATLACSGITVYSALRKLMPLAPEDPVVVFGAGGLGLAAIGMLQALGHRRIVCVEISAQKRETALAMGATDAVDGQAPDLVQAILAVTGGPVKAAIDLVNVSSTAAAGLEVLAKEGRLVLVGVGGGELVLSLAGMIFRPRSVLGSLTGNPQDLREVVALAKAGKLRALPITRMPKDQANEAVMALSQGQATGRIVLV